MVHSLTSKLCATALMGVAALVSLPLAAKAHADGGVRVLRDGADMPLAHGVLALRVVRRGVLHVHFLPHGKGTPATLVMAPDGSKAAPGPVKVQQSGHHVTLSGEGLRVDVDLGAGRLAVRGGDGDGPALLTQTGLDHLAGGPLVLGHAAGISLYGIGGYNATENVDAGLLRSGKQVAKAGEQGHAGAPFVWSTAGWGLLVDCDGAHFDLADGRITVDAFKRPDPDYYVMVGAPPRLFNDLAALSGRPPLFPKWAMGFTNSQWGSDEQELLKIVDTYRAKHIPIDNFTLDFDWKAWGKDDYGEFRWNGEKFPDGPSGKLKAMMDARGMHLTGIMKPRIHVDTVEGRYATAHHLWLPGENASPDYFSLKPVKDIDFDKPAARAWFFNAALKHSFDTGIVGWWNDEADTTDSNTQFLNMERSLYEGQRAYARLRVWSINRDFWLGAQRYAYGLWSGDIKTGFESMAGQRARMLSAIDVGEMKWGMDGGGFQGHPSDENYARWIEFGAFTPIFRVHGTLGEKRQPWVYGPIAEKAAARAIRLRYRLIPYIYAYEAQARSRGVGLVRPLLFDWPDDPKVANDVDAWLFGQWLLVSPVVEPGQAAKDVYLPAGTWTDWSSGTVHQGGQSVHLALDATHWDDIPLFIRQGAIIPMQPVMDHVGQRPVTQVTVQVFPDTRRTTFDYYDDDGQTYAYEHGAYFRQTLSVERDGDTVHFGTAAVEGSYRPALKFYLVAIHGDAAATVTAGGAALAHAPTIDALRKHDGEGWASGRDRYGAVTWVKLAAGRTRKVVLAAH